MFKYVFGLTVAAFVFAGCGGDDDELRTGTGDDTAGDDTASTDDDDAPPADDDEAPVTCDGDCKFDHGQGTCADGACVDLVCEADYFDADGLMETGCEVHCIGAPANCESDGDCAGTETCMSGVCIVKPTDEAKNSDGNAPDTSCFDNPPALTAGPATAKLSACLDVFGLDANTAGCRVEIFLANGAELGDKLDEITSVEVGRDECANRSKVDSNVELPTNTALVYKATCDGFVPSYQWNQYLPADLVQDGVISGGDFAANIIAESTWNLIPPLAGCGGIEKDKAAVAGQVQDCNRKQIENATVGLSVPPTVLSYFDGTRPDPNRSATDPEATYAACNEPNGPVRVTAAALVGGQVKTLGAWDVKAYPQSVTIITLDGVRPGVKMICE